MRPTLMQMDSHLGVQVGGGQEPKPKKRKLSKASAVGAPGRKPGRAVTTAKRDQTSIEDEEAEAPASAKCVVKRLC